MRKKREEEAEPVKLTRFEKIYLGCIGIIIILGILTVLYVGPGK